MKIQQNYHIILKLQKMKKLIAALFVLSFLASLFNSQAQQAGPTIAFESKVHDFGNIKEEAGLATYDFKFKNTGNQPLIINRVTASCGCTSPTWTREPVPPGGDGKIQVAYNPKNRPNKFNKSITVYSNASQKVVALRITGNVIPKPRTIEDDFPFLIGNVRFKTNHMAFVKVNKGQKKTVNIQVINTSGQNQTITFSQVPPHLKLEAHPATLKPNEKGVITGIYDASLVNDWGFVINRVLVNYNGKEDRNNRLTISATISEDFGSMTPEQLENAARIEFQEKAFNFGKIKQKSTVEHNFVFKNTGKSDLMIRKVRSSCGCTAVTPRETTIKPGGTSQIKAIFNSGTRVGNQNKSITVITNDPKNPTVVLRLTGEVEAPSK